MATTAQAAIRTARPQAGPNAPLRIMYAGEAAGAPQMFAQAEVCGFTHVLLAPPWRCGRRGNPYLTADFVISTAGGAAAAIPRGLLPLVQEASRAKLGLLLDVVVDRLAGESPHGSAPGSPFQSVTAEMVLDPRQAESLDVMPARAGSTGDVLALAAWWAPRLRGWLDEGVLGFRLLGLEHIPGPFLAAFLGALRQALPRAVLLCWTPGVARDAVCSLAGLGLDGVFVSLPWWDWQSGWLWSELADLSKVAPVLGVDAVPPGPSKPLAGRPEARNMALAALIGQGWLHVPGPAGAGASETIGALNGAIARSPAFCRPTRPGLPLGDSGPLLAVLRQDGADHRGASTAALALINGDDRRPATVTGASVLPATGGAFGAFTDMLDASGEMLLPESRVMVPPGGMRLFAAVAAVAAAKAILPKTRDAAVRAAAAAARLAIERPTPAVDGGAHPAKAIVGEMVSVEADIVFDGHDKIAAALRWHGPDGASHEAAMQPLGNDRWRGEFPLRVLGPHRYIVTAWRDRFATFRDELAKKSQAGVNVTLEMREGEALVRETAARDPGRGGSDLKAKLQAALRRLGEGGEAACVETLLSQDLATLMEDADERPFLVESPPIPVDAERIEARFASWYEVFPRSMSDDEALHGTFADVEKHLPRIAAMGFDVLYFPPISPIGRTNRKGRNNTLTPAEDDPGSPYAIGSREGGHDALHPQLGTFEDFARLRRKAAEHGLELAIDFAIQCSPDHPWLKQHPGWFDWRPDGSIRYAENPPKKYEDIVNVDFYTADAIPALWIALCDVVLFWAQQGIRLFRVDNPHTKPLPFWEWMIGEVRAQHPDAIFLAEAFTRPKVMYRLAKIGFSQSYTYFTWRNSKRELEAYSTELDQEPPRDFFRPHFFVNTPDINPLFLQSSGRPGFLIRAALAATLSGLWGVYNGFELCEAAPVPGKEEYWDSEKYQLRAWDWERPGNITGEITALNRLRRQNPALQTHRGVTFLTAYNDAILFFEKATPDRTNVVFVAVSLDPHQPQEADFEVPLWHWKLPDDASVAVQDLMEGTSLTWHGKYQHMRLTPEWPFAIWRVRPSA